MNRVLVLGAGKIGALIAGLLSSTDDYEVLLADSQEDAAASVAAANPGQPVVPLSLDAADTDALAQVVSTNRPAAVVSSLPYFVNPGVAEVARCSGHSLFRSD